MAVRIIKGREILKEVFERKSKGHFLLEWYKTENSMINKAANQFIAEWIDWTTKTMKKYQTTLPEIYEDLMPEKLKKPQSKYEYLACYFYLLPWLSRFNLGTKKSFAKTWKIGEHEVPLRVSFIAQNTTIQGRMARKGEDRVTIFARFNTNDIGKFFVSAHDTGKVLFNEVEKVVSSLRETITHELTHFFQNKRSRIKVNRSLRYFTGLKNVKKLRRFLYFIQEHELQAYLNGAYKLYRERSKFYSNKDEKQKKKDFLRCFAYVFCNLFIADGTDFLSGKISYDEMLKNLKDNSVHGFFLFLWIVYCYIPKNSKFSHILHYPQTSMEINPDLLDGNKKRLEIFLNSLTEQGVQRLDRNLSEFDLDYVYESIFSTTESNLNLLDATAKELDWYNDSFVNGEKPKLPSE